METKKIVENASDVSLPFSALRLLAPPMRLVSAAMWKVVKERNVLQYGVVEDFVTSTCESASGLLTGRHQAKLALGLRARLILELCSGQGPLDLKEILQHLEKIRSPVSSSRGGRTDKKIEKTVESFRLLVQTLTQDATARERFYKEEYPVEYDTRFDQNLEKLLWEFLARLEQLLPVPDLAQTVSWLSATPAVLEECAQAATQPQLLTTLLHYQSCHGHLDSAVTVPQDMGDSILTSLSLTPSGRAPQNQPSGLPCTSVGGVRVSTETIRNCPKAPENQPEAAENPPKTTENRPKTPENQAKPFISPVMGLMSSKELPGMCLARQKAGLGPPDAAPPSSLRAVANEEPESAKSPKYTALKQRMLPVEDCMREKDEGVPLVRRFLTETRREQHNPGMGNSNLRPKSKDSMEMEEEDDDDDDDDDEEKVVRVTRSGKKKVWRRPRRRAYVFHQPRGRRLEGNGVAEGNCGGTTYLLRDILIQMGLKGLKLPEDPCLRPALTSSLLSQPQVRIAPLQLRCHAAGSLVGASRVVSGTSAGSEATGPSGGEGGRAVPGRRGRKRKRGDSPVRSEGKRPGSSDKENCSVPATCFPSFRATSRGPTSSPEAGEEFIGDSEDEATKNAKGKLFVKRYFKTRHDTYVPTLREFWKPGFVRRDVIQPLGIDSLVHG